MGPQTFFFFNARIKAFNFEAPFELLPNDTEITLLPLHSPPNNDGPPPPCL